MKHTCRWVVRPATPGHPAEYCEAAVPYTVPAGPDGERQRQYASFCPKHQALVDQQEDDDDQDD